MSDPISNVSVIGKRVFLNSRVGKGETVNWTFPAGNRFVLTDLFVQNRKAGDAPVGAGDYTRFTLPTPSGQGVFFIVVGNTALSEHLSTGWPLSGEINFYNLAVSTAEFVEFVISGYLEHL
jgi:hypothetical protein